MLQKVCRTSDVLIEGRLRIFPSANGAGDKERLRPKQDTAEQSHRALGSKDMP